MGSTVFAVNRIAKPRQLGVARRAVLVVTLFGLIATACGGAASTSTAATDMGGAETALLDGEFDAFANRQVDLSELQGEDVVLWFWAPW